MLTDNGAIFTAGFRHGRCALETELDALGITFKHSRPYHPQTCGKDRALPQDPQALARTPAAGHTIRALQHQLDTFRDYYNHQRPHRALGRRTPEQAYAARPKALPPASRSTTPTGASATTSSTPTARSTLRYGSRLHHIGIGRRHAGTPVLVLIKDLDIRITTGHGQVLRELRLDPSRDYQPISQQNRP